MASVLRPGTLERMSTRAPAHAKQEKAIFDAFLVAYPSFAEEVKKVDQPNALSLAKTSSDSLRSTEIRQSVHRPKTPSLVGGRATGIVRPAALHGHTGVAREDGERAGWAAELDL